MSFVIGIFRLKVENENYAVEIIVEMNEIRDLSNVEGKPLDEIVSSLINAGVTSVLIDEYTIHQVVQDDKITALSGKDILNHYYIADFPNVYIRRLVEDGAVKQGNTYLLTEDENLASRLMDAMELRLPMHLVNTFTFSSYAGQQRYGIELPFDIDRSYEFTIGFSTDDLELLDDMGVNIVPRFSNYQDVTGPSINYLFDQLSTVNSLSTVVFSRSEVLGYDDLLSPVAQRMKEEELIFGNLEFNNQRGEEYLSELLDFQVVRIQSDLRPRDSLPGDMDVDRFVRAVRERNIRGVIVKFYTETSDTNLEEGIRYIQSLREILGERGFYFARAVPFRMLPSDLVSVIVIGLGVVGASCILGKAIFNIKVIYSILFLIGVMGIYIALIFSGQEILARQLMSLLSAITFPILAIVFSVVVVKLNAKEEGKTPGVIKGLFGSFIILLLTCAVSLMGGTLILGLLSHTRFMLNVDGFLGVKVSYILPPVLLIIAYFLKYVKQGNSETIITSIKRVLSRPITYHHMAVILVMAIIGGVYVIRSGGLPIPTVSEIELSIRSFFEHQLYARPRTKEILIGHPFLFLAIYKMIRRRRENILIYIILGLVGQVSIINSFAHVHTPLFVTLSRVAYGFLFGVFAGVLLVFIYELIYRIIKSNDNFRGEAVD